MTLTHYRTMEDAWLDLRGLLLAGLKYSALTRKELISAAVEGIHYLNVERSENTSMDYFEKRAQNTRRVEKKIAAGLCVHCGTPVAGGFSLCPKCREKGRLYRERRNGLRGTEVAGT